MQLLPDLDLLGALLVFIVSAVVVGIAGTRLARDGDVIAARTRLGRVWFGTVFLALATSLPELMTSLSAAFIGAVDIAAGNLFGSSMANMLILALLTFLPAGTHLFSRAATLDQMLSASLAIILNCIAGAFVVANVPLAFARVGLGSWLLLLTYLLGTRLLYQHTNLAREAALVTEMDPPRTADAAERAAEPDGPPEPPARSLRTAIIGFSAAAIIITIVAPLFAESAERIAAITGLSQTIVGTTLVGLSTSLPEFVTSMAAVRIGAFDLAVGNLFGSNAVNMVMFTIVDAAHRAGPVFHAIGVSHAASALVACVMMALCLVALIHRVQRRFSFAEPGGLVLILVYVLGMLLIGTVD